jgi:hypothetical protein
LAFGVGFGVWVTGLGVGAGVTRGVGAGVTRGVGAGVTAGVGAAVPAGDAVAPGDSVPDAGFVTGVELPAGEGDGVGSIEGLGLVGGEPGGSVAGAVGPGVAGAGVGVGTAAMTFEGRADAAACCCSSTPPMPSAIVASTRFSTPRLRMSRTR